MTHYISYFTIISFPPLSSSFNLFLTLPYKLLNSFFFFSRLYNMANLCHFSFSLISFVFLSFLLECISFFLFHAYIFPCYRFFFIISIFVSFLEYISSSLSLSFYQIFAFVNSYRISIFLPFSSPHLILFVPFFCSFFILHIIN